MSFMILLAGIIILILLLTWDKLNALLGAFLPNTGKFKMVIPAVTADVFLINFLLFMTASLSDKDNSLQLTV